jgi:hypothetical protein
VRRDTRARHLEHSDPVHCGAAVTPRSRRASFLELADQGTFLCARCFEPALALPSRVLQVGASLERVPRLLWSPAPLEDDVTGLSVLDPGWSVLVEGAEALLTSCAAPALEWLKSPAALDALDLHALLAVSALAPGVRARVRAASDVTAWRTSLALPLGLSALEPGGALRDRVGGDLSDFLLLERAHPSLAPWALLTSTALSSGLPEPLFQALLNLAPVAAVPAFWRELLDPRAMRVGHLVFDSSDSAEVRETTAQLVRDGLEPSEALVLARALA